MTCEISATQLPKLLSQSPEILDEVRQLIASAQREDKVAPLSEQFLAGLEDARLQHSHLLARMGEKLVGILAISGEEAELVVAPAYRRRGVGTQLVRDARNEHGVKRFWAHGNVPGAQRLAKKLHAQVVRELLVMSTTAPVARAEVPTGFEIVDLAEARHRWGESADEALLQANNEAFDWHPEQGNWDRKRWARAQEAEWFEPEDVLLLARQGSGEIADIWGFHWTKWQRTHVNKESENDSPRPATGEVYVVGLAARARGKGLGKPLISAGLDHLWDLGAEQVILYVESDNLAAVKSYEKLGFEIIERHLVYSSEQD